MNYVNEIKKLKKELNAVIMAHFYQDAAIQDIADYVGDSLALAQWAAKTDADVIVICGVHFMGETAKILSPEKLVLVPDIEAGCSLADSCPVDDFKSFTVRYSDHTVVSYVNTTAAVKALTDIVVTSSNAKKIIDSLPPEEKIIFGPDRNLGNYINSISGRNMLLWDGACHVHEQFSVQKLIDLKTKYPKAKVLAHPECKHALLILADVIGATSHLLDYSISSEDKEFIVATESGILHKMKEHSPKKLFIPVPPEDGTCACNECNFMRLNTMEKLYTCLKNKQPEITIDPSIQEKALKPIERMLSIK